MDTSVDKFTAVTKNIVIDSRQRNSIYHKTPSSYTLDLGKVLKNVVSIELKGAILPKTNYNIHSGNNKIDFAIGDTVTSITIEDGGMGYTVAPTIIVSKPTSGITASAIANINSNGSITSITITNHGTGYRPSTPPKIIVSYPVGTSTSNFREARLIARVGMHYSASLRPGEYEIGGNPTPPSIMLPTKLLLEIQNGMNYAVTGIYDPVSSSPFEVRLVSQYPKLGAVPGSPESYNTNACLFNRIQVINVNGSVWEFLWHTGPNRIRSAASVMGFNTTDSGPGTPIQPVVSPDGLLIPGGTAIRGCFDYNLKNDPDYVLMTLKFNNVNADRVKNYNDGFNETFAALLFDNNAPETLHDLTASSVGSIVSVDGVQYLQGPLGKGHFWRDAGAVKPIKGYDFDLKKMVFNPPLAMVNNVSINFTKYGNTSGGKPLEYDMEGREHVLMFEFTMMVPKMKKN